MTKDEKNLLITDISGRLTCGVYMRHKNFPISTFKLVGCFNDGRIVVLENGIALTPTSINECKPYLRPLSSMTTEEWVELCCNALDDEKSKTLVKDEFKFVPFVNSEKYLNEHHFDHRGLIPMGLAIEAPEDMYKVKRQ